MNNYSKYFNVIVVGVGGMGSAACYQLAKRGQRVLGIERFDIPHDLGSSHGYTRIIRLAYYEHPSYVMLLKRAYELWDEIETRTGEILLHRTGSIDAGPAESWVFKGSLKSCVEHDLPHEVYTGTELAERFPGYQLPHDILALYQPDGGFLLPERATVAFTEAAHALGADIHGREQVLGWEPLGEGVRVTTDRGTYEADRLVFTAGSWNAHLLPFLEGLAVPERQVLAWLQPERPELFTPDRFPVFNLLVDEGRYYGFPVFGVPGFKIGRYHHFEEHGHPDVLSREPTWEDEEALRELTARYFPEAVGPTMSLKACLFTNSPDKHFIIDLHPDYPQVSFAAGFSGHGYKFASVIGEIMADLAERGESRHEISLFSLARLTGQVSALHLKHPALQRVRPMARMPGRMMGRARLGRRRDLFPSRRPGWLPQSGPGREWPAGHWARAYRGVGRPPYRGRAWRDRLPGDQTGRGRAHGRPLGTAGIARFHPEFGYLDSADPRYWEIDDVKPFW